MKSPSLPDRLLCPSLLLAHPDPCFTARTGREFRQLGWDVYTAPSATDVRSLAHKLLPTAVLLAVDLAEESGWLTCVKLVQQHSDLPVFLVAAQPTSRDCHFARFAGAVALFDEDDDVAMQVEAALGITAAA